MNELILPYHQLITNSIVNGKKSYHAHYDRVVKLAKLYEQLITGENIDSLVLPYIKNKDKQLNELIQRITSLITPSVCDSVRTVFCKVGRTNNVTKKINFKDTKEDLQRVEKIENALLHYYGDESLDGYLENRFLDLSFTDPNAFIVTEFEAEYETTGKIISLQPKPFEVSSCEAINFKYDNNVLKWLLVELPCQYKCKDKIKDGKVFTIYLKDFSIKYTQIDYDGVEIGKYEDISNGTETFTFYRANKQSIFLVQEFEHKSGIVPAIRVGYKMDLVTKGETCVNPFHCALNLFRKTIKTVMEFDLTMCLHAFPKLFQYEKKCPGEGNSSCDKGTNTEGHQCSKCGGSGLLLHSTAQDAVTLPLPSDPINIMDLSKMIHVESLDTALPEFQNKYINQLVNQIFNTIFSADQIQTPNPNATATEVVVTADNKNNTLYPYSKKHSATYVNIVTISGYYLDEPNIIVIHKFPKDFKLKSLQELLTELRLAKESGAPAYIIKEISNDIAEQLFIDKPEELKRIRTKEMFYPFPDKTESIYAISNNLTTQYNKILWANFDLIFGQLENDAEEIGQWFYDYEFKKQAELLKSKVLEMVAAVDADQNVGANVIDTGEVTA